MTATEYLSQARRLDQRICSKLEQMATLRSLAQKVTTSLSGERVSHTRNVSSLEDTILLLVETENEMNQSIDALLSLRIEIGKQISALDDPDCILVLEKRYLCYQSWEKIAADLACTVRWVHRLHAKALQSMNQLLCEKKKGVEIA